MTIENILEKYEKRVELKTFADVMEQSSCLKRELLIEDVDDEYATGVEMAIRFWNTMDKDIPINERNPIKLYVNS